MVKNCSLPLILSIILQIKLDMDFYGCLYFDAAKSVIVVPKSHCVLRGPFEARCEAEVDWRCENGEKQRYIGTILKTAKKSIYYKL